MSSPRFTTLCLTISQNHIDSMLEAYDSGMCDRSTSNAVYLALQEYLTPSQSIKVFFQGDRLIANLGSESLVLPSRLSKWLRTAERGFANTPELTIELQFPQGWLPRAESIEGSFSNGHDVAIAA